MLELICIDVDGTLVGSSGDVLPAVWDAAHRALERGQHLALCTGRPAFGKTLAWAQRLSPAGWHLFQNGASIARADLSETLSVGLGDGMGRLTHQAKGTDWALEAYSDFDWAASVDNDLTRRHASLLGVPLALKPLDALSGEVIRGQWVVAHDQLEAVFASKLVGLDYHAASSPVMPDAMFISVTAGGVSKASAIRLLADKLGVPLERTMMVGDAMNDVEAMRAVGHPVAMGNADASARAASRYQVGQVDANGVVEALELSTHL